MSTVSGYGFAIVAAVMFGVQYLPVKKYEIFDGTTFQWFMCNGILLVGSAMSMVNCGLTQEGDVNIEINLLCMVGGVLWALSNYLVIPLVKLLGIGLGFGLYHFVNLIVGYCVGRFGMFGLKRLDPQAQNGLLICDLGCGILLLGFVIMVLVESSGGAEEPGSTVASITDSHSPLPSKVVQLATEDEEVLDEFRARYRRWRLGEANGAKHPIGYFVVRAVGVTQHRDFRFAGFGLYQQPQIEEELSFGGERKFAKRDTARTPAKSWARSVTEPPALTEPFLDDRSVSSESICQKLSGIILAIVSGTLCGLNNVPPSVYTQSHPNKGPFAPVFSQCLGIWLTSTLIYVVYSSIARLVKWPVPHSVIRPALVSGSIWAVGFGCMLGGIKGLGYSIGYTLDAVGPVVVSSTISIVVYKEIRGCRKLSLFAVSLSCQLLGVWLIAFFGV